MRFSSLIRFTPNNQELKILTRQKPGLHQPKEPWSIDDRIKSYEGGFVENAYDCHAGGFQNGQRATVLHLCPVDLQRGEISTHPPVDLAPIQRELASDLLALSQNNTLKVQGLITGGKAYEPMSLKPHGAAGPACACSKDFRRCSRSFPRSIPASSGGVATPR